MKVTVTTTDGRTETMFGVAEESARNFLSSLKANESPENTSAYSAAMLSGPERSVLYMRRFVNKVTIIPDVEPTVVENPKP